MMAGLLRGMKVALERRGRLEKQVFKKSSGQNG